MGRLQRVIALVLCGPVVAFTFEPLLAGALAMPHAEVHVTGGVGDHTITPRKAGDLRQPAALPAVTAAPDPGPTATPPPPASLAGLRRQGITPAILLAGDLLLLIVALIIVIIERRRRPRER
jgi:hypothetical protein